MPLSEVSETCWGSHIKARRQKICEILSSGKNTEKAVMISPQMLLPQWPTQHGASHSRLYIRVSKCPALLC